MKKKSTVAVLTAVAMTLALMGCGVTEEDVTASTADYTTTETTEEASEGDSKEASTEVTVKSSEESIESASTAGSSEAIALSDDSFEVDGNAISVIANPQTNIEYLGGATPEETTKDKDITYYLFHVNDGKSNISLTTYTLNGKEETMEFIIEDPGVKTSKGIEVGATKDEVTAAYGTPAKDSNDNSIKYAFEGYYITFQINNGKVINIYYTNTAIEDAFYANK